jgi:hypothetical protein
MSKIYEIFHTSKIGSSELVNQIRLHLSNKGDKCLEQDVSCLNVGGISLSSYDWCEELRAGVFLRENDGKFVLFDLHDKKRLVPTKSIDHPQCLIVLKRNYRPGEYKNRKVSPFVFGPRWVRKYEWWRKEFLKLPKEGERLYFKGAEQRFRQRLLPRLVDKGIVNPDWEGFHRKGKVNNEIGYKKFLYRLAISKIALALPGKGNFCYREIEAFGLRTPVLMPRLLNSYYDNLVPNEHYVSIEHPDGVGLNSDALNSRRGSIKKYATAILDRYREVKDDRSFLEQVAESAFQWYEKNVRYPNNMLLMERILKEQCDYRL